MLRRQRLAKLLDRTGVVHTVLALRRRLPSLWFGVLTYHSVRSIRTADPFDPGVVDASAEELDEQIAALKRDFTFVGIDDVLGHLRGAPLPKNPILLTFDDGYRDSHDVALPILLRHGVRAVFFVATAYVSERRLFWWDRIACVLARAPKRRFRIDYPAVVEVDLDVPGGDLGVLLKLVKRHEDLDLERFLLELTAHAGVEWSEAIERELAAGLVMTWDHVRALSSAGMDVASHTRTHRVLGRLSPAAVRAELRDSKAELEREIGKPVRALAYPVGAGSIGSDALRAAVAEAGYDLAFTNKTGVNFLGRRFDPLNVRRVAMEKGIPETFLRGMLALPVLAGA